VLAVAAAVVGAALLRTRTAAPEARQAEAALEAA